RASRDSSSVRLPVLDAGRRPGVRSRSNLTMNGGQSATAGTYTEDPEGRRDPCTEAQRAYGRIPKDRPARQEEGLGQKWSTSQPFFETGRKSGSTLPAMSLARTPWPISSPDKAFTARTGSVLMREASPGTFGSTRLWTYDQLTALASSTNRSCKQGVEHGLARVAAVVPPHVLVDVALEPLVRDRVIRAPHPVLEQAEEPLDGLRVYVAVHVDAGGVVDPLVLVALLAKLLVRLEIVGVDDGRRDDVLAHLGVQNMTPTIRDDRRADTSSTLDRPKHDGFPIPVGGLHVPALAGDFAPVGLAGLSSDERFVGLDVAGQLAGIVLDHQLVADEVEHAPCGLVRHAKLALQLLGRDPASSARHDVHGVKPHLEGRRGLLKDRALQRVDASAAGRAEPRRTRRGGLVPLEGSLLAAPLARRGLAVRREAGTPDELQASLVVRELSEELQDVAGRFGGSGANRISTVNRGHLTLLVGKGGESSAIGSSSAVLGRWTDSKTCVLSCQGIVPVKPFETPRASPRPLPRPCGRSGARPRARSPAHTTRCLPRGRACGGCARSGSPPARRRSSESSPQAAPRRRPSRRARRRAP